MLRAFSELSHFLDVLRLACPRSGCLRGGARPQACICLEGNGLTTSVCGLNFCVAEEDSARTQVRNYKEFNLFNASFEGGVKRYMKRTKLEYSDENSGPLRRETSVE